MKETVRYAIVAALGAFLFQCLPAQQERTFTVMITATLKLGTDAQLISNPSMLVSNHIGTSL